jgi:hypothetical protein
MQYVLGNMLNGGGINPDGLSLDLQFAADKTLTARRGPTPTFTRSSGDNGGTTYFGPLVDLGTYTEFSTTGITNGRASWFKSDGGNDVTISYTGTRWRVIVVFDGIEEVYLAAPGSEWRPDQADWSSQEFTITTSSTFGIVKAANNEPRFDHDPLTLACKGLLIEEARTNLLTRSSNFPAGSWSINAGRLTWALDAIGPDGALSATTLTAIGLSGAAFINSGGVMTAGVTYTHSAIVKAGSSNFVGISSYDGSNNYGAMFNLATGTFVGYRADGAGGTHLANSITSLGGGWYRVSFTYTAANTYTGFSAQIMISQAGNLNFATSCTAGASIIAFAYQMEAGSFPTSYIPTTTGTLARSADVCNITGGDFNNFYNQSEGTLLAECQTPSANQYAGIAVIGTTSFSHNIALFKSDTTGGTVGNRFVPYVTQAGSLVAMHDFGNESGNGNLKVLASVALNNMIFARNGTLSPLDSTAAMPTPNRITIGGRADGNYINGHIAAIRYYKKRLPDANLVTLTT